MKVAILSDIHGNIDALKAVIMAAECERVSRYIIAGDMIGYYYGAAEVAQTINALDHIAIRGNHEDLFSQWIKHPKSRSDIRSKYGSSFDNYTAELFTDILNLPACRRIEYNQKRLLLCHGTPWDPDEYLYPDAEDKKIERLFSYNEDILIFGHTHIPALWQRGNLIVVNPGSVGQPRDYKPGACWALWDTTEHKVELKREKYDVSNLLSLCRINDPDLNYLQDVLVRDSENKL